MPKQETRAKGQVMRMAGPSKKQMMDMDAESDMNTMMRAEEIQKDSPRMARMKRVAKMKMMEMARVAGVKGKKGK